MGVVHERAPVFSVGGDAGAVDVAVSGLRTRGERFVAVAGALELVSTDAWSGRAADRFRDRFDVEPVRWRDAGEGFFTAASGLSGWAGALRSAGPRAVWCREEWARGEAESVRARAAYDADVRAGRAEKAGWEADNGPGTFTLTVHPFVDSGEPVREGARVEFASVVADLEAASEECARLVRAGCEAAPGKRNWLESGLAFVGGVFVGAGEALWDLGKMVYELGPVDDLIKLATGDLTPEELAATYELKWETAQGLWDAASSDPWGFGLEVGKSVLDWDTWADDPARALGHLVPDAVAAVFTAGSSAAVTRGGSAMATLGMHADDLAEGAVDVARVVDRVEGVSDLRHLDELADLRRIDGLGDGPLSLPLNQFPGNEAIRTYMSAVPEKPGFYDVGLHGSPDLVEIALNDGRRVAADHRLLSQLIRQAPDYDGGPVRLLSCSTGSPGGRFAQDLANKLGQVVDAPTDTLWLWDTGKVGVGPNPKNLTGSWKTFTPGG